MIECLLFGTNAHTPSNIKILAAACSVTFGMPVERGKTGAGKGLFEIFTQAGRNKLIGDSYRKPLSHTKLLFFSLSATGGPPLLPVKLDKQE
jgi:hypothetical protein